MNLRGGKGKGKEGEGKDEGKWRGPKSGLPRGPRWLSAGLPLSFIMEASTQASLFAV